MAEFTVRALSETAVQVIFAQKMKFSAPITDTSNYTLTDLTGASVSLLTAVPNNNANILRVRLNLGASLVAGKVYALHITNLVLTDDDVILIPSNASFVWHKPKPLVSVPLARFTGEIRAAERKDRLLSELLFFSESLAVSIEPDRPKGNTGVQLTTTLVDEGNNPNPSFEQLDIDSVTENVTAIQQTVRLQTRLDPFDPARPNYLTSYAWSLLESVEVVYTNAITSAKSYSLSAEEKLTSADQVSAERPLSYLGSESLGIREQVRVLPEPRRGLDPSAVDLFGSPNGQVFFSPSLLPGLVGQSTIRVDEVQTCTRASDVYKPPAEVDPFPLYTHGGGLVPAISTTLSPGFVLIAPFARLAGAKTNVGLAEKDSPSRPVDIGASITLTQVYDPARFSLLNSTGWHLFDNSGLSFVVADNLTAVGSPVVGPGSYFTNPAEDYLLGEALSMSAALSVGVSETVTLIEEEHFFPGSNQVLALVSEGLTFTEVVALPL